jgi:hypothetical protein
VPDTWSPTRPGELVGRQPSGRGLGYQGPDQGFALAIAEHFRDRLILKPGEREDDAIRGCLVVALRRASMFGRAPTVHDLTVAFVIWGFLRQDPPEELVKLRRPIFEGVGNVVHHYAEARAIADMVPESTLRMTHQQVQAAFPTRWSELLGVRAD